MQPPFSGCLPDSQKGAELTAGSGTPWHGILTRRRDLSDGLRLINYTRRRAHHSFDRQIIRKFIIDFFRELSLSEFEWARLGDYSYTGERKTFLKRGRGHTFVGLYVSWWSILSPGDTLSIFVYWPGKNAGHSLFCRSKQGQTHKLVNTSETAWQSRLATRQAQIGLRTFAVKCSVQ